MLTLTVESSLSRSVSFRSSGMVTSSAIRTLVLLRAASRADTGLTGDPAEMSGAIVLAACVAEDFHPLLPAC